MSKGALIAVLAAGAAIVVALAVLTPTVIVGDGDGRVGVIVSADSGLPTPTTPAPAPTPRGRQGLPRLPGLQRRPFRNLWRCLQQHGFDFGARDATPPDLKTMREAMRACRSTLPGLPANP